MVNVLTQHPGLAKSLTVFVTGSGGDEEKLERLRQSGVKVELRRLQKADVFKDEIRTYYLCTGTAMRKQLMEWLPEKELVSEDFNF